MSSEEQSPLECQCNLPERMPQAGPANLLCHHSDSTEIARIKEDLIYLANAFPYEFNFENILHTPINELNENYKHFLMGSDYEFMTREEHAMITVAFLRQANIIIQATMTTILQRLAEGREESARNST